MRQPSIAGPQGGPENNTERTVVDTERVGDILNALEDEDCRAILAATQEQSLSASELSEECDLPLSTTYRKLEQLTEVKLLDEEIRLSRSGKHTSEYVLAVEDVHMSVSQDNGVELQVTNRADSERATSLLAGAD